MRPESFLAADPGICGGNAEFPGQSPGAAGGGPVFGCGDRGWRGIIPAKFHLHHPKGAETICAGASALTEDRVVKLLTRLECCSGWSAC